MSDDISQLGAESNWDEFIEAFTKRHGIGPTSCFILLALVFGVIAWGIFTVGGLIICTAIVVDSSRYISAEAVNITIFGIIGVELLFIIGVINYGSSVIFVSVRELIAVLAFIQTVFWVIDHETSLHEPRSVLLLVISTGLAYYEMQIKNFFQKLPLITNKVKPNTSDNATASELILPFLDDDANP